MHSHSGRHRAKVRYLRRLTRQPTYRPDRLATIRRLAILPGRPTRSPWDEPPTPEVRRPPACSSHTRRLNDAVLTLERVERVVVLLGLLRKCEQVF
jgi:hypothetical protein